MDEKNVHEDPMGTILHQSYVVRDLADEVYDTVRVLRRVGLTTMASELSTIAYGIKEASETIREGVHIKTQKDVEDGRRAIGEFLTAALGYAVNKENKDE